MNNLAIAIIDGNLTHDPETKKTKNDRTVTTFNLALNHEWGSSEDCKHVSFIPVEAWDRLAEIYGSYLKNGREALPRACNEGIRQMRSFSHLPDSIRTLDGIQKPCG